MPPGRLQNLLANPGPDAAYAARVVLEVVDEATTGALMDKVRVSLPDDIRELVGAGGRGDLGSYSVGNPCRTPTASGYGLLK